MNIQTQTNVAPMDFEYLNTLVNMEIDGHMVGALAEFIDNSIAAKAKNIDIHFKHEMITVIDDGEGVKDLSEMFCLGRGSNRHDTSAFNLGQYGQGGTSSALYIGWHVSVFTVHSGEYKVHSIDWRKVLNKRVWPSLGGETKSIRAVPSFIKNGGTMIMIKDRHTNLKNRKFIGASMAKRLSKLYAPALLTGIKINLHQYNQSDDKLEEFNLSRMAMDTIPDGAVAVEGIADGKPFKMQFGVIPHGVKIDEGIHITFGPRVIETLWKLKGKALPPTFWAKIDLGAKWKSSLSRNKGEVQASVDELEAAVYQIAGAKIEELRRARRSVRMDMINGKLSDAINTKRKKPEFPDAVNRFWEPCNWKAARKEPKSSRGVEVTIADLGEACAFKVVPEADRVVVMFNENVPFILQAYSEPVNSALLFGTLVSALTSDIDVAAEIAAGEEAFDELLQLDDTNAARAYLQWKLLMDAPVIKEPTKAELEEGQSNAD